MSRVIKKVLLLCVLVLVSVLDGELNPFELSAIMELARLL